MVSDDDGTRLGAQVQNLPIKAAKPQVAHALSRLRLRARLFPSDPRRMRVAVQALGLGHAGDVVDR